MSYQDPCPPVCPPVLGQANFKIEAVVVCDKYHDFLRHTIPANKILFNKIVVVTSYEDKLTQRICEFNHVECIRTDRLESRKGIFRKACGINDGLAKLDKNGWVVHLDADIWLPPQTRYILEKLDLDPTAMYGMDRFIVKGPKQWEKFQQMPPLQHECASWVHPHAFPLGTRVFNLAYGGAINLGFYQMWRPKDSGVCLYPEDHDSAGRTDVSFNLNWPRSKRGFLPEIISYHLESDDSKMAANWDGRTTSLFELPTD